MLEHDVKSMSSIGMQKHHIPISGTSKQVVLMLWHALQCALKPTNVLYGKLKIRTSNNPMQCGGCVVLTFH